MTEYRKIAALGSSYAAGPGVPPVVNRAAMRSGNNYSHVLSRMIGAELTDLTVSGATTSTILDAPQRVGLTKFAPQIASLLFRQDPLGVLVPDGHRFAELEGVSVAVLAEEPLLLAEEAQAPEFNQFTVEMCRAAGFTPTVYEGTVESIRAAADLVAQGRCLYCVPSSCIAALPGPIGRPLTEPASCYPWSILWRAADDSGHVRAVVSCAQAMSKRLGWLSATAADQTAQ